MYRYIKLPLLAIAIAATGTAAYAADGGAGNDAMVVTNAKIPLTQAINVATQHAHGTAARAEYENSKQGWVYDVEVVSQGKIFDVKVDPGTGKVISSAVDKVDHDDYRDTDYRNNDQPYREHEDDEDHGDYREHEDSPGDHMRDHNHSDS